MTTNEMIEKWQAKEKKWCKELDDLMEAERTFDIKSSAYATFRDAIIRKATKIALVNDIIADMKETE